MTEFLKEARPELLPEFLEDFDEPSRLAIARIFDARVEDINSQGITIVTAEGFTVSEQLSNIAVNTFKTMRQNLEYWRQLDPTAQRRDGNG